LHFGDTLGLVLGDNGLSNSPAGCVSFLSFHLFLSPISKKWIVLSYLHNPFYTTAANSVLSGLSTQNTVAANSLSGSLNNYVAQNQDAVTLVSSEIDNFMPSNTSLARDYASLLTGKDGFISQGNSATKSIAADFHDYILVGDGTTTSANDSLNVRSQESNAAF